MKKLQYFAEVIKRGIHLDFTKEWFIATLSVPAEGLKVVKVEGIPYVEDKKWKVILDGTEQTVEDADPSKPFFSTNESVTLPTGFMECISQDVKTTYHTAILNAIIFEFPLGSIVPFQPDGITPAFLKSTVENLIREDKMDYPTLMRMTQAIYYVGFLNRFCLTVSTVDMLRSSSKAKEVRDKLVAENQGKLSDKTVVAKIDKEIQKVLWDELKGDDSEGFFTKKGNVDKVRKMTHGMIGGVPKLDNPNEVNTITRSLLEGWQPEDIPYLVDNLRGGSYDRGKDTALGGEAAKFSTRVFQNIKIAEKDCGTKVGVPILVEPADIENLAGYYVAGSAVPLDEKQIRSNIGKTLFVRSSPVCNTKGGNFCERCMGDKVANSKLGLNAQAPEVVSNFLSMFLAAFHGKELKVKKYNFKERLF